MKVLLAAWFVIIAGLAPVFRAEQLLPKDYEEQIKTWIFERCPREITAIEVTPFLPKQVAIKVENKNGFSEVRNYTALQLEWISYGDVDGREGVALLGLYQGVYLFNEGKLVNEVVVESIAWADDKPERLRERILLERKSGTLLRIGSHEEQRVLRAISKATVVRYALVERNGLGEHELRSDIGTLKGRLAEAVVAIVVDPKNVNPVSLMCIPKFNLKLIFGSQSDEDVVEMLWCTGCRQTMVWLNRRESREIDFTPAAQKELLKILAGELPAISSIPSL